MEALLWLKSFLGFFMEDFQQWQSEEEYFLRNKLRKELEGKSAAEIVVPPEQMLSRTFIEGVFKKQIPLIIQVILGYTGTESVDPKVTATINKQLSDFVLVTNKQRSDFENIFHELKKQFKGGGESSTGGTLARQIASTRKEIIITWFTDLFNAFKEELIDKQTDVFEQLINSLDFSEQNLVNKVLGLLCMLSQKNEKYLKKIIKKLIERFQNNVRDMNQDKINQVISVLCNSIQQERVFLEFARILGASTSSASGGFTPEMMLDIKAGGGAVQTELSFA
jgi:hypothetical protein